MTQKVVAVTGISGVGKTTFVSRLAERVPFQHLTGGSLIASARASTDVQRDALRHLNLDNNQQLLIAGYMAARDPTVEFVLFDGHTIIDSPDGLAEIPIAVFKAIGVWLMVHLEADPVVIQRNRERDPDRKRPAWDLDTLREHQNHSRRHAMEIGRALQVECLSISVEDITLVESYLTA